MLNRIVRTIAAFAALFAIASTGAARATTTTIYLCDSGDPVYKINSDGTGNALAVSFSDYDNGNPWNLMGWAHPSYALHGGRRWFVEEAFEWHPDGTWDSILIFRNDAGTTFTYALDPDIDNASQEKTPRWTPDDGQITLTSRSSSTGAVGMFGIPVTFDVNGNPSIGQTTLRMATPYFVDTTGTVVSVVGNFDWNPAGTAIGFQPYGNPNEPLRGGLYTLDASQHLYQLVADNTPLSGNYYNNYNAFGWGVNNRICYSLLGGVYTVNPDGSGLVTVLSVSTKNTKLFGAQWSPDASRIAYVWQDQNMRLKGAYWGLETIAATGGTPTKLATSGSRYPIDWR